MRGQKSFLRSEWLENLNGDIDKIFCNSSDTVEWVCRRCHRNFKARISERKENDNCCPYCSKRELAVAYNDLATTHPLVIKEWSALNDRESCSIMCNSTYRAWRKCNVCKGEYQQTVKKKILMKESCPYCQNNKVLKGFNDLETTHKHLMNEWDYLNNILLADPTEINEKYQQTVWWICKENSNHRYKLKINEKIKYEKRSLISCPICKGLRRKQEHFVRLKM